MTELTIPPDADEQRAAALVHEHITPGDTVEIWERDRTSADEPEITGEVTGLEPGYLELDGQSLSDGSVRYDEIGIVIRLESA